MCDYFLESFVKSAYLFRQMALETQTPPAITSKLPLDITKKLLAVITPNNSRQNSEILGLGNSESPGRENSEIPTGSFGVILASR